MQPVHNKNATFFFINSLQIRPDPKFWSDFHSGSNPNSTKVATVRIQSNPSPVQCSSLDSRRHKWWCAVVFFAM